MIRNKGTEDRPAWFVRVSVRKGHKILSKKRSNIDTLRQAKQIERQLYQELQYLPMKTDQPTFPEVVDGWATSPSTLETYSPGTVERYRYSLERGACLAWPLKPVSEIDEACIRKFLDDYVSSRNLSQNSKAYQRKIIASVMEYARALGYITRNPCENIRIKERRPELNIWSGEQLETFLRGVKKLDQVWYSIFALASLTGMRAGELAALKWSNVNLPDKVIKVSESLDWRTQIESSTKNKLIRVVPINSDLNTILETIYKKHGSYVLPRVYELLHGRQAYVLKSFAKLLGLPPIRFHDLRAIFACQLALSGCPMHVIKSICGWNELQTVQRYMRLSGIEIKGATDNLKIKLD